MKRFQFIFLRLCVYLIAGILCAFYFPLRMEAGWILAIPIVFLVIYFFVFRQAQKKLFPQSWPGITSFLLIFSLGYSSAWYSIPENQPGHYIRISPEKAGEVAEIRITEELKPSFTKRYIGEVTKIFKNSHSEEYHGKILLNVQLDSLARRSLRPGSRILVKWNPDSIKKPLNPYQFDYARYMRNLKVERQLNLGISDFTVISGNSKDLRSLAWNFREKLIKNLKEEGLNQEATAVLQALILGQRRDIQDSLYKSYAAAGAIHILAISGLHIGILLLFLNFIFKPLERSKYGKIVKIVLILSFLWGFAILSGLSPSVVRAVCMFSFLAIGLQLKRKTSVLNSLFLSLFFLLLYDPFLIFQLGFQLSYLAVLGIIILQPILYGIVEIKKKIPDYFWKLITASVAAQLAILPLSLYYFHQFPGLFLVSNIIILPLLGFIMGLGFLTIILAWWGWIPDLLNRSLEFILLQMNRFVIWIADKRSFVITDIEISTVQCLIVYVILIFSTLLLLKPDFRKLVLVFSGILILQISVIIEKKHRGDEAIIFHRNKQSLISFKSYDKLKIMSDSTGFFNFLSDYQRAEKIQKTEWEPIQPVFQINGNLVLVIDTLAAYEKLTIKPDILLLKDNPRVNLERIISSLKPQKIVADGSNSFYLIKKWRQSARNKKIPFHYTGEKGALILE
ncbi:ComEC family competence protein [Gramella sp. BOM4]|nr:ComEC family competence protein [Christiangramia bathymodioli]